jgi:uncharacterized protein YegP (UPF0339 family)
MRQFVVCLALLAGFAAVVCSVPDTAVVAQGTKKTPHIEVSESKDGKFRFTVRSGDGKLLAMSGPTGHADEKNALKAIEDLKAALKTAKITPTKKSPKSSKPAEGHDGPEPSRSGPVYALHFRTPVVVKDAITTM